MSLGGYRTLLVVGENHAEIAARYSASSTKANEKYVKYKLTEAPKLHRNYIKILQDNIKALEGNSDIMFRDEKLKAYNDVLDRYVKMDDFEFFGTLCENGDFDDDGNLVTDENPDAHYEYEECYDERVRLDQDNEAPFADPLILKDGSKAYSAKVCDVDWNITHMGKSEIYEAVWEICVEGREPQNDDERNVIGIMGGKTAYFSSFASKDEYVAHNCSFWCYCIADSEGYDECKGTGKEWVSGFYERFIKPLPEDTLISVYQVRML